MFQTFFIKIYFLFLFLFLFIIVLQKYLPIEVFYIAISLYGLLVLPLQSFFHHHFQSISSQFSFKNMILNPGIYVFIFCIICGYFLAFNTILFLIITLYLFFIAFKINYKNLFFLWFIYFLWFLWFFSTNPDSYIYSSYFIFSLYSIILWIFTIIVWESFFSSTKYLWCICFIVFFIIFMISFYFHTLFPYLPVITLLLLVFFHTDKKFHYISNKKTDSIIFSLYFIGFIPLINDFLILEEKNTILLWTSIWFLLLYIWYNLIIKKALG